MSASLRPAGSRVAALAIPSLLALLSIGCALRPEPTDDPLNENKPRTPIAVVEVADLDHIKLADGRVVALHGIQAAPADHPIASRASDYLRGLIEGKEVIIDGDIDNWYANTWHAYVFLPQGKDYALFVNGDLARKGYAYAYTTPPNDTHESWISEQAFEAREEHLGVWADRPEPSEHYTGDRYSNYFHRHDCVFAKKLQYPDRYGTRADAVSAHRVPCPDCKP